MGMDKLYGFTLPLLWDYYGSTMINLVGGLEPWNLIFHDFSIYWEWNVIIPTDFHSIIFQRGRAQPPTSHGFSCYETGESAK